MLGIFDSGTGAYNALSIIRRHIKREDVIILTDRKNAPYGTKSRREILRISKENIETLRKLGARKILIACCTASTVYPLLENTEREITCNSITPTIERTRQTGARRIVLLATERTVKDGAFKALLQGTELTEISAQPLVKFIDEGARDGKVGTECRDYLTKLFPRIQQAQPELIILGCTHFHSLRATIQKYCATPVISSAHEGAVAFLSNIKDELCEGARTLHLS